MLDDKDLISQLTVDGNPESAAIKLPEEAPQELPEQPEEAIAAPVEEQPQQPPKETDADRNWREIRARAQRAEDLERENQRIQKERDDAYRLLQAGYAPKPQQPDIPDDFDLADDDIAEGKHTKILKKQIRQLKEDLENTRRIAQSNSIETEIRSRYPDVDQVLTKESIDSLQREYPELHQSIFSNPDQRAMAIAAYSAVKKLGLHGKVDTDLVAATKNQAKPRSLNSIAAKTTNPLSQANAFVSNEMTPELKQRLYAEMMEKSRNR